MAVKAVEMVRKIRDEHYEKTKNIFVEKQIAFIKQKSKKLQQSLKRNRHSAA